MPLTHDTIAFLDGLRANNDRQWFEAHKTDYQVHVKHAGEAFAPALAGEFEAAESNLLHGASPLAVSRPLFGDRLLRARPLLRGGPRLPSDPARRDRPSPRLGLRSSSRPKEKKRRLDNYLDHYKQEIGA